MDTLDRGASVQGAIGPVRLILALACAGSGVAFALSGATRLIGAKTTVNPTDPSATSVLVTGGAYRLSRHPMYLGFLLMLVSYGIFLGNILSLLLPIAFVVYMNRFQIKPEERVLKQKFGATFEAYQQRVRRWL